MRLADIHTTFRRDLLEVLRDRRSLVFMILLPTMIIPLIMVALSMITKQGVQNLQATPAKVAVLGEEHLSEQLREYLHALSDPQLISDFITTHADDLEPFVKGLALSQSKQTAIDFQVDYLPALIDQAQRTTSLELIESGFEIEAGSESIPIMLRDYSKAYLQKGLKDAAVPENLRLLRSFADEVERRITAETIDALIVFHPDFSEQVSGGQIAEFTVFYSESHDRSRSANRKIRRFLRQGGQGVTYATVLAHDLPLTLLAPLRGEKINVGEAFNVISRILPYFIILTCFIGGLYPALDNLAGEKERQTFETLLLSPASRSDIMIGKYLVIFVCAVIAATLCMGSLSITLVLFGQGVEALDIEFRPVYFLLSLLLVLPLAMVFAAVLMTLSLMARGYKQAQSYVMPINFLIIIPAFYSLIPGSELGVTQAMLPVINVSLALREVWSGITAVPWFGLIVLSSLVYAVLAILFCAYMASKESVLFRD